MTAMGAFLSFDTAAAKLIMGEEAPQLLADFLVMDDFLRFEAPDTYHIHPHFATYLSHRLAQLDEATRTQLYQIAAHYCEQRRDFPQALRCYRLAGRNDKIVQLVVYLLENAEGCVFAELCADYMDVLTPQREQQNPSILGAKAMFAAYRMDVAESQQYLQRLKERSEQEDNPLLRNEALSVYIRTLMASPCVDANTMKDNLFLCAQYVQKHGMALKHIMPTGNLPSIINGGVDLLAWMDQRHVLYPLMKATVPLALGVEGVGVADAALGEAHYQWGENTKAIARLSQALSDANFKGSIRVQYAVTAIMALAFQSEGQGDTAQEILTNVHEKAVQSNFTELIPNIVASLLHCDLLSGNLDNCTHWLQTKAPDEHAPFYITARFRLLTKARVYAALGRELEALHIVDLLTSYAQLYHRTYFQIELLVFKAMLHYRRHDPWQGDLLQAVALAHPYGLKRIFADQGAALLPLWRELDWKGQCDAPSAYLSSIGKQLKDMATHYPNYLQIPTHTFDLSEKEVLVLTLLSQGASNTKIAEELHFTISNAKFHVSNIMKKLNADNRTSAVTNAQTHGLI